MQNRENAERFERDGTFVMFGRRDAQGRPQVRRLEFTTTDGLGHAVSRVCSRRECYTAAMAIRAAKLADGATACPKPAPALPGLPTVQAVPTGELFRELLRRATCGALSTDNSLQAGAFDLCATLGLEVAS